MSRRGPIEDAYPLAPLQHGLLFHALYSEASGEYVEQLACTLRGTLDGDAFRRTWEHVVSRHTALRTTFVWERDRDPFQLVHRRVRVPWQAEDWRDLPPARRDARFEEILERHRRDGFDPARPPLMRFALVRTGETTHRFVWSHHHLLMDGWSLPLVLGEVFQTYRELAAGRTPDLPPARPYRAFIDWLGTRPGGDDETFWRRALAGVDGPTPLGVERPRTPDADGAYAQSRTFLDPAATARLQELARRRRLTPGTLVQGAWALLLGRYADADDVVFGLTVSGRPPDLAGAESMVGLFINTVPVRVPVPPTARLAPWLADLQRRLTALQPYHHTPLSDVQRWSGVAPGTPLFETLVVIENYPSRIEGATGEDDHPLELGVGDVQTAERTNYPVTLSVVPQDRLALTLDVQTGRIDRRAAGALLQRLTTLLQVLPDAEDVRLGDLPLLTAQDHCDVSRWAYPPGASPNERPESPESPEPLHRRFARHAARRPEAPAVEAEGRRVSYERLDQAANTLAAGLVRRGVGRETRVGLHMERSPRAVVAVLAVLKAGGAFVPLDPSQGSARVEHLTARADLALLLTDVPSHVPDGSQAGPPTVTLATLGLGDDPATWPRAAEAPQVRVTPDHLAYCIFTSGSTGLPKGVLVGHGSLSRIQRAWEDVFELSPGERHLQMASFGFDVFIGDLARALGSGGCLVLCPRETLLDPPRLHELLEADVDVAELVPAVVRPLVEHLEVTGGRLRSPRLLSVGSDLWYGGERRRLRRVCRPELRIVATYGVTEATIDSSYFEGSEIPAEAPVPIGRPFGGDALWVVDRELRLLPPGVVGELGIGGAGLARGYLGRPGLTAERFVPDPWSGEPGARLYRTGDRVRHLPEGDLEILGRVDHQVQVRGMRVEPGEVEAALTEHPDVARAVVAARRQEAGENRLVAWIVPRTPSAPGAAELRRYLGERLPAAMVPTAFATIYEIPLTPNGKVDRGALPEPEVASGGGESREAPRTPLERELVRIWSDVLQLDSVGVDDDFFDLGGDSILSIRIVARARQAGLRISPRQLFEHSTPRDLARVVVRVVAESGPEAVEGPVPLTPIQAWFLERDLEHRDHYNQSVLLQARRPVAPPALAEALHQVLLRHDALRLRFQHTGARWRQRAVSVERPAPFYRWDLGRLEPDDARRALERCAADLQRRLDLGRGPILRVAQAHLGESAPERLLVVVHHLAMDGVSWGILLEDLATAHEQMSRGRPADLGLGTTPFTVWAQRLRSRARTEEVLAGRGHWTKALGTASKPLPTDRARRPGALAVGDADTVSVTVDRKLTAALLNEARKSLRAEMDELLLTALARSLAAWSEQPSVLVELEGHGRQTDWLPDVDLSRTIGWFTAVRPVRLDGGDAGPGEALGRIKQSLRAAPGQGLGFGLLRWCADDETRSLLADLPEAEISFNYLGQVDRMLSGHDGDAPFEPAPESAGAQAAPEDPRSHLFEINALVYGGRLRIDWTFSPEVHQRETVDRLIAGVRTELEHLVTEASRGSARVVAGDFPLARLDVDDLERLVADGPPVEDVYPLSPVQQGMLFQSLLDPAAGAYVEVLTYEIDGPLNVSAFRGAWSWAVRRHPALRTDFAWRDLPEPHQIVRRHIALPWTCVDWRGLDPEAQDRSLHDLLTALARRPFDLDRAPLMDFVLVRTGDRAHRMLWSHHHLLLDGWSMPVLTTEVLGRYRQLTGGPAPDVPAPRPYRDFIAWLADRDASDAERFWQRTLAGFARPTPLAFDRAPGRDASGPRDQQRRRLSRATTAKLRTLARRHRLTENTVVQACWAWLLDRYAGHGEVVYGSVSAGRPAELPGLDRTVGLFISTLPVRIRISRHEPVGPWLRSFQGYLAELLQYEHVSLLDLRRWSDVPADRPLFESLFVFENYPSGSESSAGGDDASTTLRYDTGIQGADVPLVLAVGPGDELLLGLDYAADRFDAVSARRMLGHLEVVLGSILDDLRRPLGRVPHLRDAERAAVLVEWPGGTDRRRPVPDLMERLTEARDTLSDRIAVEEDDRALTYGELSRSVCRAAVRFRRAGVGPETVVAVCAEMRLETLVDVLGILAAGGAYLPLDPTYPTSRLTWMLDDSGARILLTEAGRSSRFESFEGTTLACGDRPGSQSTSGTLVPVPPETAAYVIYTSGSTGEPKGVTVARGNLAHLLEAAKPLGYVAGARTLQFAATSFDASVIEIFPPLAQGATMLLAPRADRMPGPALAQLLARRQVTQVILPPSALALLPEVELPALDPLIVAGEACPGALARRWSVGRTFVNGYGPTEGTVCASVGRVLPQDGRPALGRPVCGVEIYVLDRFLEPTAPGVAGEIVLGGDGVARGYLGRPGLAAERFVPAPDGARRYRTGDLGRWLPDGRLDFLGRLDEQLKVRGFRIEPGEVETWLAEHSDVHQCVVVGEGDGVSEHRLAAFVVPRNPDAEPDPRQVRAFLRERLPEHLVPSVVRFVDELPRLPNGKLDRARLASLEGSAVERMGPYLPPRTELEILVADAWSDVLGVERVGLADHFFDLGGHSLLAVRVQSRLRRELGRDVPLLDLFRHPTVGDLAAHLEGETGAEKRSEKARERMARTRREDDDDRRADRRARLERARRKHGRS